jgi:Rieske Fe-S protein
MERRSFLKWATQGLGALFGAILGFPAVAYLIDARNRSAPPGDFRKVGKLSDLKENVPHQVVLNNIRRDAWTLHPNDVIGRVWLVRRPGDKVDAYTTICPHLGCAINYQEPKQQFVCPCHNGTFHLSGQLVSTEELGGITNPAPRDMDSLEIKLEPDPAGTDTFIWVKYENFIQGRHDKVRKA